MGEGAERVLEQSSREWFGEQDRTDYQKVFYSTLTTKQEQLIFVIKDIGMLKILAKTGERRLRPIVHMLARNYDYALCGTRSINATMLKFINTVRQEHSVTQTMPTTPKTGMAKLFAPKQEAQLTQ